MVLFWGLFVNWLLVLNIDPKVLISINRWVFMFGFFGSAFYGIYLFNLSDKPLTSFVGYNFVVVPFGLIVNMVVAQFAPEIVIEAKK